MTKNIQNIIQFVSLRHDIKDMLVAIKCAKSVGETCDKSDKSAIIRPDIDHIMDWWWYGTVLLVLAGVTHVTVSHSSVLA